MGGNGEAQGDTLYSIEGVIGSDRTDYLYGGFDRTSYVAKAAPITSMAATATTSSRVAVAATFSWAAPVRTSCVATPAQTLPCTTFPRRR